MTSPTGSIRPLQYPLNRNEDVQSETPNETITHVDLSDWSTSDPDERIDIVLNLSLNEYVAIASCVDVGRDIAYGDNSIYLWWLWTRSLLSMSICDSIVACINDENSGVANAIMSLVGGSTLEESRALAQTQNSMILGDGYNPTCDKDILYGQIRQLVDYLNAINFDILEIIEVATNLLDGFADVVGDISLIDESSIDAGLSWIAYVQDNIAENYAAQVTETYLEDLACDIFCIAKDQNCAVTPELLFDIFVGRLSASLSITGLILNTWAFLIAGTWVGTEIADFMFLSQLGLRSQVGKVLDVSAYWDINTRLQIYSNDPNPDWLTLCTNCPSVFTITVTFDGSGYTDYVIDQGTNDGTVGNPAPSGKSVRPTNTSQIQVFVTLPEVATVNSVTYDWLSNYSRNTPYIKYYDEFDNEIDSDYQGLKYDTSGWNNNVFGLTVAGVKKIWVSAAVTGASNEVLHMDNIEVTYEV